MIDLTDVPEAQIGDQVIIYGDGSGNTLDIDAVSRLAGTNKNEIVARLTRRPPRIYVRAVSYTHLPRAPASPAR